jgi:hypothetical protein
MPKIEDFVEGDPVVEDVEDDSDEDSDDDGPPERERPACKPFFLAMRGVEKRKSRYPPPPHPDPSVIVIQGMPPTLLHGLTNPCMARS